MKGDDAEGSMREGTMSSKLPADQVTGISRRNVGSVAVATIHDGMLATAFGDVLGVDPALAEALHRAAHRPMPPELSCNTFAVDTGTRLMLVDAGCGWTAPKAGKQGQGLAALGITPDAIDAVLMTHLHRDHAAGLVTPDGRALFPNAELVLHADDLAFWRDERSLGRLRESQRIDWTIANSVLDAYADRLRPVTTGAVMPHVSVVPTPGHTPGHAAWLIDADGAQLLISGDVVHFPALQFAHPDASVVYDVDPAAAAETRRRVLDWVSADRIPIAGVHLDFPCYGHVEARPSGGFGYVADVWSSTL